MVAADSTNTRQDERRRTDLQLCSTVVHGATRGVALGGKAWRTTADNGGALQVDEVFFEVTGPWSKEAMSVPRGLDP